MSLLDDVSIVVTPNGYKAGTLYGVLPTYAEGSELVTNGDFATDLSGWSTLGTNATNTITWETNGARIISTGVNISILQTNILTIGKTYKLTCDVAITVGKIGLDGATSGSTVNMVEGFNEIIFTAISTTFKIKRITGNDNCLLDNVSVKEVTSSDMDVTRATAATRVDENGLVNYAEVIGGEEVPSIIGILNLGGGTITQISGNSYSSTSDGTSGSGIRPKFDFNTTAGKRYKLTITPTGTISGTINFDFYDGSSYLFQNYDFTTTKEIYFIDNGSVFGAFDGAKTYDVSSFTVSVKEAARDNVPRIDYTGGGCPHILAEPQRTNFVTTSASGSYGSAPASEILAIAPDGENTAIRPVPTSASNRYQETIAGGTYSSGDEVTYSWYRKRISTPVVTSYIGDLRVNALVNCTQVGVTTEIASSINGYDRFSATFSITDGSLSSTLRFYFGEVIGTGNSLVAYWGHQLEEGSYATSYIPTSGSTVTRNQDIFTRDGIGSLINSTEGVLFVEMALFSDEDSNKYMSISDGTDDNKIQIDFDYSLSRLQYVVKSETVVQVNLKLSYTGTNMDKIAVKWKVNDFAVWLNGVEIGTDTSGLVPIGLNTLNFSSSGSNHFQGKVKQLQVYDTALTDDQLEDLTS